MQRRRGQLRKAWPLTVPKQDKLKVGSAQSSLRGGDHTGSSPVLSIGGRDSEYLLALEVVTGLEEKESVCIIDSPVQRQGQSGQLGVYMSSLILGIDRKKESSHRSHTQLVSLQSPDFG